MKIVKKQQYLYPPGKERLLCVEEGIPVENMKAYSVSGRKPANTLELAVEGLGILAFASCLWTGNAYVVIVALFFVYAIFKAKAYHDKARGRSTPELYLTLPSKSHESKVPATCTKNESRASVGISKEPSVSWEKNEPTVPDAAAPSIHSGKRKRKRLSYEEELGMSKVAVLECVDNQEKKANSDERTISDSSEYSYEEEDAFVASSINEKIVTANEEEEDAVKPKEESPVQTFQVIERKLVDLYGERGIYTGSLSNAMDQPHGFGRLLYGTGRWYDGEWCHGRWSGKGRLSNGDGDLYDGELRNDHKHGKGTMRFVDGRVFVGKYVHGQMSDGKMTYQDGSTYEGSWVDGMRQGRGKCVFTDGAIYVGEFREGEFHGHGKMTWRDGGYYEGEWWHGEMQEQGKEIRPNGTLRHEGRWSRGVPLRRW